jgi:hypothetical protein
MAATTAMGPAFQQLMAALKGVGGAGMGLGKAAMSGAGPAVANVGVGAADLLGKGGGQIRNLAAMLMKNPKMTGGAVLGAGGLAGGLGLNALMNQGQPGNEQISPETLQMLLAQLNGEEMY